MIPFRTRRQRWLAAATVVALLAILAAALLKPVLERAVRGRFESAALRHGMVARIGEVRVGVWPFLRLEDFNLDLAHGLRLHADRIAATYSGRLRLALQGTHLLGPAGLKVGSPDTAWQVTGTRGEDLQLTLIEPQIGLLIREHSGPAGGGWNMEARELDVGRLLDVRRDGAPLLKGGVAEGRMHLRTRADSIDFDVDIAVRDVRFRALAEGVDGESRLGEVTEAALRFDGLVRRAAGTIEIADLYGSFAGAELSGSIILRDLYSDPGVDIALGLRQLDFGRLLGATGLALPGSLATPTGSRGDLGSASVELSVRGRASEPAALAVNQKVHFSPPAQMPRAIARLRGDFVFGANEGLGPHPIIDVSPASPDFVALHEVPPLFVRALLLSEDAGFYGHQGIDLRELPVALLTNWSRGTAARGASTLTQQLAKNLFLTRDKEVGRKLQELSIAFLLESALGKDRILEIYLNIIEWGPDLRGLRPAARHYFDCEPQALTPAQMAFLVAIIPGPIKYQRSIAQGTPSPGLRSLIDNLLAKLRSVQAIDEDEFQRALLDPLHVRGGLATADPATAASR